MPDEPDWYQKLATHDLSMTFSFDDWCEIVGGLQQLVVDRSRNDYGTVIKNDIDPLDLERLMQLSKQMEDLLLARRDS